MWLWLEIQGIIRYFLPLISNKEEVSSAYKINIYDEIKDTLEQVCDVDMKDTFALSFIRKDGDYMLYGVNTQTLNHFKFKNSAVDEIKDLLMKNFEWEHLTVRLMY